MQASDWIVYVQLKERFYSQTLTGPISVQKVEAYGRRFLHGLIGMMTPEEFINNNFVFYLIEKIKVCIISLKT